MSQIKLNISQTRGYDNYNMIEVRKYCNVFVDLKLALKKCYQVASVNTEQIRRVKAAIENMENTKQTYEDGYLDSPKVLKVVGKVVDYKFIFNLKRDLTAAYKLLEELKEVREKNNESITRLEGMMMDLVYYGDKFLSTHQKIQLLGGGMEQAQRIIRSLMDMEKLPSIDDVRFIDLVMHHTEYQWNKQRERDWIDCKCWEMPVFQACMNEMIRRTDDYEKQTGRCMLTEILEECAKDNGKKLVPIQTEVGTVLTFNDDIESKYERSGKVITLTNGSKVTINKK
ncbi:MAG: hypothetical protein K2G70_02430 [Turicibacter sp.]|nr:hypothetical protein [Turicibacter sp.]